MEQRLQTALQLARQAGDIIRDNFEKKQEIELKPDHSPVTAIDKQINSLVAETLQKSHPTDGLLGEEGNAGDGTEQYQWICDPIDGTKPFILGLPNSVFMLGLSENGAMLLSVVYDPYADRMYRAVRGGGAFCNDEPIHVSTQQADEGYAIIGPDSYPFALALKEISLGTEPVPGTGYKCMMLARGYGLGMINDSADFHDIGPGSLIVEEAGGKVTNLAGQPLRYDGEINGAILTNGVVHDAFVQIAQDYS